jgi:RecB family endonuclease NucS
VHQLSALAVTGGRDLELTGSEEDLRRRILDDPALVEEGFEPIETERPSGAGPIDIFGTDGEGTPVVVELKRRRVGPDAAGQLKRYVDAIERELGDGAVVRGVLVAPSVTDRTAELLEREGLEFVPLTPTAKGGSGDEAGVDGAGVDEPGESNQADADADGTDESNDE